MTPGNIQEVVENSIRRILRESGRDVPEIEAEATFAETLKLDSLDLAVLVVALESELHVDPFRDGAAPVRTVGELVSVYESVLRGA